MNPHQTIPIPTVHLLPVLDNMLINLLQSLTPQEWDAPTIAKQWKVKNVVAHLLDGNIRVLSMLRDGHTGPVPTIHNDSDLLNYLNGLNADWVQAMKRVSPAMLLLLHQTTGPLYCKYYASLDPFGQAGFAVNWAGETVSKNWMHLAREYTEKWLHQQQIREAVNKPGLLSRELFYPFIQTFMMGLPHTYRHTKAPDQTKITVTVTGATGGSWHIIANEGTWTFTTDPTIPATAEIQIEPALAWKLFSKSIRPDAVMDSVTITGDRVMGEVALHMVSVMA